MIREALKLAAVNALRGVLLTFVVPVAAVLVLVGGLIGGVVAAIFGGTGSAAHAGDCFASGTGGKGTAVHASQVEVARAIDEGVRELGFSGQASRIAIIAAYGESSLENINYGDGAVNPDGSIASSIGIFQQQNSWGSREERMNPKIAAQLFILGPKRGGGGLADVPGWSGMSETAAIHAVQKNAGPNHYARSVAPGRPRMMVRRRLRVLVLLRAQALAVARARPAVMLRQATRTRGFPAPPARAFTLRMGWASTLANALATLAGN